MVLSRFFCAGESGWKVCRAWSCAEKAIEGLKERLREWRAHLLDNSVLYMIEC